LSWALLVAAMALGALHIRADYQRHWARTYIYKPMAMVGIIALVLTPGVPADFYRWAVLSGLVFSLAGDIFLMLKPARFLPGLFSFLLAHLVYVCAFSTRAGTLDWPSTVLAIVLGAGMLLLLWPGLGRLRGPVTLYVAAIIAMVATALSAAIAAPDPGRIAAATGALLFLASDACLGYARFRRSFPAAQGLILGSYYPAQALIALSAGGLYA